MTTGNYSVPGEKNKSAVLTQLMQQAIEGQNLEPILNAAT